MPDTTDREITVKDFKGHINPDWCPGCGDYSILAQMKKDPEKKKK